MSDDSGMDPGLEDVTTEELLRLAIEDALIDLHVAAPCTVDAFDASKNTVDVTIAINRSVPDGAGNYVSEKIVALSDIPVGFHRGGGFFASFPLKKGDTGVVHFCHRNIGAWRQTGSQGDPGDLGMHTLDGAYFSPSLAPDSAALKSVSATNLMIGKDGTSSGQIEITPAGEIHLGAGAAKQSARNGDHVDMGTIQVACGVGPLAACIVSITITDPDGTPTLLQVGALGPFPLTGKIKEGSAHVKVGD